jgi:hypothetical protein
MIFCMAWKAVGAFHCHLPLLPQTIVSHGIWCTRNTLPILCNPLYAAQAPVDLVSRQQETLAHEQIQVLSQDPLIYLVPDLLSPEECRDYQNYVQSLSDRTMTRSNPPQVSLELSKLWPLPVLSLLAGVPPVVRGYLNAEGTTVNDWWDILQPLLPAALWNSAMALLASGLLAFAVVLPALRLYAHANARTSVAMALNQEADMEFVRPLVERIECLTTHPWTHWEAPVVTRYDPGARFALHGDASPTGGSEWQHQGGQRIVTCIVYLNCLEHGGGATSFPSLNLAVEPRPGQGLVFFPADSCTFQADDRTLHESLPTLPNQVKWIVQLFGRAQRVPPPLGLPDAFGVNTSSTSTTTTPISSTTAVCATVPHVPIHMPYP